MRALTIGVSKIGSSCIGTGQNCQTLPGTFNLVTGVKPPTGHPSTAAYGSKPQTGHPQVV